MKNKNCLALQIRYLENNLRLGNTKFSPEVDNFLVVETNRGFECGKVVVCACHEHEQNKRPEDKTQSHAYVNIRRVIRTAHTEDLASLKELDQLEVDLFHKAREIMKRINPEIYVKRCELLFDRKKLYVYFIEYKEKKDKRHIKLQEWNKIFSTELGYKAELREVGLRALPKVLGGIGICGKVVCCCSSLKETKSIGVRLVKDQGLSMNPKTLCGVCGKLKCCFRYEKENYVDGTLNIGNSSNEKNSALKHENSKELS